jgi:hypothetical protein
VTDCWEYVWAILEAALNPVPWKQERCREPITEALLRTYYGQGSMSNHRSAAVDQKQVSDFMKDREPATPSR